MFGKITYQGEAGYVERLLADEAGVMLTVCTSHDLVKLYRLDYTLDGYPTNVAVYDLITAIYQFQRIVEQQTAATPVHQPGTIRAKLQAEYDKLHTPAATPAYTPQIDDVCISYMGTGYYSVAMWDGQDWFNCTTVEHDVYLHNAEYQQLQVVEDTAYYRLVTQQPHQVPDRKFHAGQRVYFSNITHDEFDRPIRSKAALKVLELAEQGITSYDYKVESIKSGNIFYVKEDELQAKL